MPARYISISASSTELSRRTVALDNRCLEGLAPQFHGTLRFTSPATVERGFVAASPGILPAWTSFITPCTAKPIRFGIQQCVQNLFNRSPHHCAEMIPDRGFINLDHLAIAFNPSSSLIAPILPQFRKPAIESAKDFVRYRASCLFM
jgi:hypothetical protein